MEILSIRFWCLTLVALAGIFVLLLQSPSMAEGSDDGGNARKQLAVERLRVAEQRMARDPADLGAHVAKAHALWDLGDSAAALEAYFAGLYVNPDIIDVQFGKDIGRWTSQDVMKVGDQLLPVSRSLRVGESLSGKTLLVYYKKGHGDTLQFSRFLWQLLEEQDLAQVLFIPQKALESLMSSSFAHIDDRLQVLSADVDVSSLDYDKHIHLLGLPHYLGVKAEEIPKRDSYLFPSDESRVTMAEAWDTIAADGASFKVGLVWQGDPSHIHDKDRSVSLAALAPLQDLEGISYYSLQVGHGAEQLVDSANGWELLPVDLGAHCGSFDDTASLMCQMDLIVTVDTACAHLAGGLGCKTVVMLPRDPDLRWAGDSSVNFWSEHASLLRQRRSGDWDGVVQRLVTVLAEEEGC